MRASRRSAVPVRPADVEVAGAGGADNACLACGESPPDLLGIRDIELLKPVGGSGERVAACSRQPAPAHAIASDDQQVGLFSGP